MITCDALDEALSFAIERLVPEITAHVEVFYDVQMEKLRPKARKELKGVL